MSVSVGGPAGRVSCGWEELGDAQIALRGRGEEVVDAVLFGV